jgi:hypothetical protein
MNYKKKYIINILVLTISFIISFVIFEIGIRYFYETKRNFPSYEDLVAYQKLGQLNHHIRDYDKKLLEKGNQYYSTYKNKKKEKNDFKSKKVLILQGDSWVEILDRTSLSKRILTKYDIFINGGTSSYSPSLMEVQLNDIIADLGLKKNEREREREGERGAEVKSIVIMAYIDQTDFMDEACDYIKFRVTQEDGKLISVRKPSGWIKERYTANHDFEFFNTFKIKTIFLFANRWNQFVFLKQAKNSPLRCNWKDIEKFLMGKENNDDFTAFRNSLVSYIKTSLKVTENLILLTHRHRKHFEGIYSGDINITIQKILEEEKLNQNVKLVDLSKELFDKSNIENSEILDSVFPSFEKDNASHPHFEYYDTVLVDKIYNLLD